MKLTKKQLVIKESVIARLKIEQTSGDTEVAHCNADDLLCELLNEIGLQEVVDEYIKIGKWYA
tara:strand:+ start:427 stop:615 length:189 start_codon:yes stop_codon:yes gene_type:complete